MTEVMFSVFGLQRAYLDTSVYANVQFPVIEPERDDN